MQENIIDPDNMVEITTAVCLKTCKTCKKSLSTVSEYKMHIKEHRKVSSHFLPIKFILIICFFFFSLIQY